MAGTFAGVLAASFNDALAEKIPEREAISFRAFGTLGLARSSTEAADFVGTKVQSKGAGYSSRWSARVDSKLGLQMRAELTKDLEGVLQVVSPKDTDTGYRPYVEWANLKYDVTPDLSIRAGRIVLPAFMVSESRLVGYTNTWVRPPLEVYNLIPFTNSDGIDSTWKFNTGNVSHLLQGMYGNLDGRVVLSTAAGNRSFAGSYKDIVGVTDEMAWDEWTVRAAVFTARGKTSLLPDPFKLRFLSVGATYDPGGGFLQGEWGRAIIPGLSGTTDAAYVMGGLRYGALTPYLLYSVSWPRNKQVSQFARDQRTVSAGLRWDVAKNAALKVQFDHVKADASTGGAGYFVNVQPGFFPGGKANIFSVVLDFTF